MSLDPITLHRLLKSAVSRAGEKLGFILLTGSSENFIRDCLAYECFAAGLLATRDFRIRSGDGDLHIIDLAVGRQEGLDALIELKQLYLKDLRSAGPLYFGNVTKDILKRASLRSLHSKAAVYGIVLLREVDLTSYQDSGQFLAYAKEDFRELAFGVSRMHGFMQAAPGMKYCSPADMPAAQLGEWLVSGACVRLYGWVLTPQSDRGA